MATRQSIIGAGRIPIQVSETSTTRKSIAMTVQVSEKAAATAATAKTSTMSMMGV